MFGMIATSLAQICAFLGLILCFSLYLSHIRREYQLIIIFLLGDNMSSYYWEMYSMVMGREAEESALTYIGWNIGYVMLLLLALYIGGRETRRYFHPLMLAPLPAGVAAFHIFIGGGNALNVTFGQGAQYSGAIASTAAIHVTYDGSVLVKENGGYASADVPAVLEEYQAALDEAGYQDVLAEAQRQYNEWK